MVYALGGETEYYQPPEVPACGTCDGGGTTLVAEVLTGYGEKRPVADLKLEVNCYRCDGSGVAPPFDPLEDPGLP